MNTRERLPARAAEVRDRETSGRSTCDAPDGRFKLSAICSWSGSLCMLDPLGEHLSAAREVFRNANLLAAVLGY